MAAHRDEQPGAGQGGDQAQGLLRRTQSAVGVGKQFGGDHDSQQCRLGRVEHRMRQPVEGHHDIYQPYLSRAVDGQEKQHDPAGKSIDGDQQRTTAQPVDNQARGWREEARRGEEEEGKPRGSVAVREGLDPDAHGEPQARVAEEREDLAGQVYAGVAVAQDPAH